MNKTLRISGTGCCLVDRIYPDIRFSDPGFARYLSREQGDGGLHPGRLVFAQQFESFAGSAIPSVIEALSKERAEPILNVGGPSIVALIHAAQLLHGTHAEVKFYGARGNDSAGAFLQSRLQQTPVMLRHFRIAEGNTPSTIVLSDPTYQDGHGERMFINDIGVSAQFTPRDLDASFFDSDIVVFGGTALVPHIHDGLTGLLQRSKSGGCITVVNTVFDFRSELKRPGQPWPLGEGDESYPLIDLLIMDREEAFHLSGKDDLMRCADHFMEKGVSSLMITNGIHDTTCGTDGRLFQQASRRNYPISASLSTELNTFRGGDTTGCGDNFVGGVVASMALQLTEGRWPLDMEECLAWGTVSGGYCCFQVGGTFIEREAGERIGQIRPYVERYKLQIHG